MARPEKTTVEYFSHDVKGGQTLYILESKFGNDGYAFWFKLLEIIGDNAGHSFDCGNVVNWEFLLAKTRVSEETAENIMDTLVRLNAIDAELWSEHRIVWIQKFVDRLASLYAKRTDKPVKPCYRSENPAILALPARKPDDTIVSGAETPQRRVKESKGEESRVEVVERACACEDGEGYDGDESFGTSAVEHNLSLSAIEEAALGIGLPFADAHYTLANDLMATYTVEWVLAAISRAAHRPRDKLSWGYIKGILRNWREKGGVDDASKPPGGNQGAAHGRQDTRSREPGSLTGGITVL